MAVPSPPTAPELGPDGKTDSAGRLSTTPPGGVKRSLGSRVLKAGAGCVGMPCQIRGFLKGLHAKFGFYVATAAMQYGVNQGLGFALGHMARRVYFAKELKVDGATGGRYVTAAMVPWSIKPLFGMLSDSVPFFGYHKTSYLVLAGCCGVVAWSSLGALPLSAVATVPFLVLVNISVVIPDVIVDARTAELSKEAPESASDLQSLSWGALAIGGLVTCSTSGLLVDHLGPRVVFLLVNIASLSILIPGVLGWLGERRLPRGERRPNLKWFLENKEITMLAVYMSTTAVILATLQIAVDNKVARGIVTIVCSIFLVIGLFTTLRRVSPVLAKTAIFIFAQSALQPAYGEAMFQWLMNYEGGPQFSPTILSWIDCFGSLGLLVGVTIYNKYLSEINYRKIFLGAQATMVVSSLFDVMLVKRWNLKIGIPDIAMLIGDDAFTATMRRFFAMPMFILAAKVCPDNVEATLFAMLMALSNFGGAVADFIGVTLLEIFGVVDGNFERLGDALVTKTCFRFLPMLLIPLLVPNLKPTEPIPLFEGKGSTPKNEEIEENEENVESGDDSAKSTADSAGAQPETHRPV